MGTMRSICLALLLVGACAGSQANGPASNATPPRAAGEDPDAQECHEETPTGSNLPRTICRSKLDNTMDHQGAQEWHSLSNQPPVHH
jgi:hypothetical protein